MGESPAQDVVDNKDMVCKKDTPRLLSATERTDFLADWQHSRSLSSNVGQSETYKGPWPCDLRRLTGLRVDGRAPTTLIGRKIRDAVGGVQEGVGNEKGMSESDADGESHAMFDCEFVRRGGEGDRDVRPMPC